MSKLVSIWSFVRRHKYLITLLVFAVLVGLVDENSLWRRWEYSLEEHRLREEINKYRADYEESTRRLNELQADSSSIERVARERYFMKKPDEDIYVFEQR